MTFHLMKNTFCAQAKSLVLGIELSVGSRRLGKSDNILKTDFMFKIEVRNQEVNRHFYVMLDVSSVQN